MDMATQLELFIDIVQQGTFSKGALLHGIERSVASKQIKALEEELGVRLLNRSTRSLSLTDAGKEVFKQAEIVRHALVSTRKLAETFHTEPKGVIRVTSYTAFGQMYLREAVTIFMKRYPKATVELVLDDKLSDLIGEQFDVTFRIGTLKDSSLITKRLGSMNLAILASESFIKEHGKPETLDELLVLPAISYLNNELNLNKIEISEHPHSNQIVKKTVVSRFKANDTRSMISALEEGIGYSLVSLSTLDRPIKEMGLVPLLTNYKLVTDIDGIYAAYPHRNQTPMVKLLIEVVQEVIGSAPIWESYIDNYYELYRQKEHA